MPNLSIANLIRTHLNQNRAPSGYLLVHRTVKQISDAIHETGFNTQSHRYTSISSTATVHRALDAEFLKSLYSRHKFSTHHVVIYVPDKAVEKLREHIERQGLSQKIPRAHDLDVLSVATGGVMPSEWVVGTFDRENETFSPNSHFRPTKDVMLPKIEDALYKYTLPPALPRRRI